MYYITNVQPGEVLQGKFLTGFTLSAYRLAQDISIPQTRLSEILIGRRRVTADTALRLGRYFGNSPKFWLGLQNDCDLEEEQRTHAADLAHIPVFTQKAA